MKRDTTNNKLWHILLTKQDAGLMALAGEDTTAVIWTVVGLGNSQSRGNSIESGVLSLNQSLSGTLFSLVAEIDAFREEIKTAETVGAVNEIKASALSKITAPSLAPSLQARAALIKSSFARSWVMV